MTILLDHTKHLVLRSLAEGQMRHTCKVNGSDAFDSLIVWRFFSFHIYGCFSSLYLSSCCEFGARFTVLNIEHLLRFAEH